MRHVLKSVGVAASLALVLVACGIKGSPKPPLPPSAPPTETQPPPQDPGRGPIEPSGPTLTPAPDAGTIVPGTETP
jgi:predicted small lipoprotein YifL